MLEYIEEFTANDVQRVNELEKSNFENATPEDIRLFAKWEAAKALQSEYFKQQQMLMQEEHEVKLNAFREQAKTAKENLRLMKEKAFENLERVNNG